MKKYFIQTFGCQMNERDSLRMAAVLEGMGFNRNDGPQGADVILVNTCSIREKSEHKVYSILGRFKKFKNKNNRLLLGVTGCVAQQVGDKFLKKVPELDMVIGTHNIHKLQDIIAQAGVAPVSAVDFFHSDSQKRFFAPLVKGTSSVTAFVTIMEGCNNFCAFCVVPYLRGRELSRPSGDIINEINLLTERGVREVTLLGQNVNSYYEANGRAVDFSALLDIISGINGIKRIRFISSHPKDLSNNLVNSFATNRKLCRHIHLPVQSGSNSVLERMNRKYTRERYLELIDKLRGVYPDIAITTDVIVGFPGETETDFEETLSLLERVRFDGIFSFKFSPRPNTVAAGMDEQVDAAVKSLRLRILQDLQGNICFDKNRSLVGEVQEVLVEGKSCRSEGGMQLMGRTTGNLVVNFPGEISLAGKLVDIKITNATPNTLIGEILKSEHNVL